MSQNVVPHHIQMVLDLQPSDRTDEEVEMLQDWAEGKGEYADPDAFKPGKQKVLDWGGSSAASSSWSGSTKSTWNSQVGRCYEGHEGLKLPTPQGERVVYGGSCSTPIVKDADVYVGLDHTMASHPHRFPWTEGEAIHYIITDGSVPKNLPEFKQLVIWLSDQILAGKKVHLGCIGGHGRTGLVLAAITATLTDLEDPITYVRTNYCKKAVESTVQVEMLVKEYNCKKVEGSKAHLSVTGSGYKGTSSKHRTTVTPVQAKHQLWPGYKIDQ